MPLAEKCLTLFPKRQRLVKLRPPKTCFRRRQWHPTPVLLPGKSHGWRSLVGYNPWGLEESDMTERLHFHFSLSCIGEGNGNPLQYCCLENPRTEDPGRLQSMGSQRVGHDWATSFSLSLQSLSFMIHWTLFQMFMGYHGVGFGNSRLYIFIVLKW